jgi:hypothetical protein
MTASSLTTSFVTFVSEIVYIDGFLYGMNGPALTRININTGVVTTASVPELVGTVPALTAMGAGWTTIEDELYFTWNGNGVIYRIDDYTVGGSPSATPVLQGQMPVGSNDGASCPNASSPVPGVGAVDDVYELDGEQELTVTPSAGTLINDTGDSVEVSDYTQPAHGSVVMNPDGSFTYNAEDGFIGTDTFTYTITDVFDLTSTATVTITVNEEETSPPATADSDDDSDTEQLADTGVSALPVLASGIISVSLGLGLIYRARRSY